MQEVSNEGIFRSSTSLGNSARSARTPDGGDDDSSFAVGSQGSLVLSTGTNQQMAVGVPLGENNDSSTSLTTTGSRYSALGRKRQLRLLGLDSQNNEDDDQPLPGAYSATPNGIPSQPLPTIQYLNVAPQEEEERVGPVLTAEVHPATDLQQEIHMNGSSMLEGARRKVWMLFSLVILLCGAVLVIATGVELAIRARRGKESVGTINPDDTKEKAGDSVTSCSMDSILAECDYLQQQPISVNNDKTFTPGRLPSRCVINYINLKETWLPLVYPSYPHETPSCHPVNLALWALAADIDDIMANTKSRLQRFALLALFYSTSGPQWLRRDFWAYSVENECDWFGVDCDATTLEVERLILSQNRLKGTIPTELMLLTSFVKVDLMGNSLTGTIPREFGKQTSLSLLALESNSFEGTLPTELFASFPPSLERLFVDFNGLTGTIATQIGLLTALVDFRANFNDFVGPIPTEMGNCERLVSLELGHNSLLGGLPVELGQLSHLEEIVLSFNSLKIGELPSWIWDQKELGSLALAGSGVQGTIPEDVGRLLQLSSLEMDWNDLTGPIPTTLAQLNRMKMLSLDGNRINGTIPSLLGLLTNLNDVTISNNALTGNIPTEIGLLTNMERFHFGVNDLSGRIPQEVCDLWNHRLEDFGNPTCRGRVTYGGLQCPNRDCCRDCPNVPVVPP